MKNIILFFLCISSVFGQVFQISSNNERSFSINRIDKLIYAKSEFTGKVYEYDLKNNLSRESTFPNLPTFANKIRKAVYEKDKLLYLYDLDKNITTSLGSAINYDPYLSFSPNDLCLLVGQNDTLKCIFFTDTGIKKSTIGIASFYDLHPAWTSDSTIMYPRSGNDMLYHYNLNSQRRDTLIDLSSIYKTLLGYDYNKQIDALAYSYESTFNKKIILSDMKTKEESIIVDYARDFYPSSSSIPFGFTSLKWSPDWKKLSFFGYWFTNSISSIFTYYLDSNKTKLQTKLDDFGKKTSTEWLNNDSIVFVNMSLFKVTGFSIPGVYTTVKEEQSNSFSDFLMLKNYPNPFNNSTILEFTINESSDAEIFIYNLLGQLVYHRIIGFINAGRHSYYWYGIDQAGKVLSSGMYIAVVQLNNYNGEKYLISKKLQLIK